MVGRDGRRSILRGEPLDIEFLGFRSNTFDLQRHGWQIAEERNDRDLSFRIAIRHPDHHMSGMSEYIRREQVLSYRHQGYAPDRMRGLHFHIDIAVHYMVRSMDLNHDITFFPVDATPVYEEVREEDLYDMPYFRPIDEGKEIFLRKASVDEIMQIALDKQEPEQARIRASRQAEQRREDYARGGKTEAKLILVA